MRMMYPPVNGYDFLMGMVKRSATNMLKHGRSKFTSKISGTVGDILMYQARGQLQQFSGN